MDSKKYEHVRALVSSIHGGVDKIPSPPDDQEDAVLLNLDNQPSKVHQIVPSLVVTSPPLSAFHQSNSHDNNIENEHSPHKRFSFAVLRRHSNTTLNRCESMGSLSHRALLQYLDSDDLIGLKAFLESRQVQVDDRDENGTSVLMLASQRGATGFVRELISRGADIQAADLDNWSALLCGARYGHVEIVESLLDAGADVDHRDMGNWTPLMWASYKGHTAVVSLLLDRGADVQANGNYHLNALLWAAGRGHTEIVKLLVNVGGAKVNVGDKYGTTPLVWACRKGNAEIVDILLKAGANVDTAGMYSWTPLLVSVSGGHQECVSLLLERKPNVNALDKDGMTALSIACRDGKQEIASALIAHGAYVNIQDRAGDSPLINAVKGGHRTVVEILLKRHADMDIQGKDRKTALYTAVEKGHTSIVKLILHANPDLELSTKDGDTPLLRAVRNRNLEILQMLLEKKAKVGATDKKGDTCLHVAMRARSKAIVEALLSNPKYSQLLYRSNKAGETPYGIDTMHQKTILGQVFGARRLNTNEDSEGMLGYGLYSSALADVLSEPTLTMPITVGLYAKWGSGKSFLLVKLREEMKSFAHQWAQPPIKAPFLFFVVVLHIALLTGTIVGLSSRSYIWGSSTSVTILLFIYILYWLLKFINRRYDINWVYTINNGLTKKLGRLRLIMQVAFCHPPGPQSDTTAMPVRFHFAEASSAAPTGELAVAHMLASLFDAIESHYGSLATGLYRAFRPRPLKATSGWRWRRMCCLPVFILFELGLIGLIAASSLTILYLDMEPSGKEAIVVSIYILLGFLLAGAIANLHAWSKVVSALFMSQGKHLKRAISSNEGAPLTALGAEVSLMTDMVKCLDAFTCQQSRLVGVVDSLDSCDTERTLNILNAIQTLLSTPQRPFVLLLAVDPHVIAKSAEANSRRLFTEGGIGGHDFLRNLVHLPVYLQNSGLRKVQRAQQAALNAYRRTMAENMNDDQYLGHSVSARRLSNASEIMASNEKLRGPPPNSSRTGSKKLRLSESIASSIGSNLHKLGGGGTTSGGVIDLSRMILTDDYFSDVNPRSMRRLMNVIYITVRLLKAFQIEFSWYRLSSWINLTEQWPLRASMIVLEHDQSGDNIDETSSLQSVYDKVRPKLSCLREAANLMDLDRDERKLDAFLQLHKGDLLVSDLRIFLPFTINLDPYLRKVLKEDQQALEDEGIIIPVKSNPPIINKPYGYPLQQQTNQQQQPSLPYPGYYNPQPIMNYYNPAFSNVLPPTIRKNGSNPLIEIAEDNQKIKQNSQPLPFDVDISHIDLVKLGVDELINLLGKVYDLKPAVEKLGSILRENAINGRVLMYCQLDELKSVLQLNFGHWEIFKMIITALRSNEGNAKAGRSNSFKTDNNKDGPDGLTSIYPPIRTKQSILEKQVTLEEQMICGALQTLNEEAFEDVVGSDRASPEMLASPKHSPNLVRSNSILKPSNSIKRDRHITIVEHDHHDSVTSPLFMEINENVRKKSGNQQHMKANQYSIPHL